MTGHKSRLDRANGEAATAFDSDTIVANWDRWGLDCNGRALLELARTRAAFTADDMPQTGAPEPDNPGRMGALFRTAHRKGLIEPVGYQPSAREGRNGSVVRVWRGTEAARAGAVEPEWPTLPGVV